MTEQEKIYFDSLSEDRTKSADVHDKPSERGYWKSVVDKYSEQAHFVYELLQNADDCKATKAQFILKKDGLFFIHDGKDRFTVSNPDNEKEDTKNRKLGHINSICSIGNSTKSEQTIGKFGVGFKSVFPFTKTPHIYDRDFQFTIKRFIVPSVLSDTERKIFETVKKQEDETVFWFPFDHEKTENINAVTDSKKEEYYETWNNRQRVASEAYADISNKLKSLVHPVLFLTHLKAVSFDLDGHIGKYSKQTLEHQENYNLSAELLSLAFESDNRKSAQKVLIFSRATKKDNHSYSVGFFLKDEKLAPVSYPAFCFFPTRETTNLNFMVHAPFLLTDNRESIMEGEEWNKTLVQKLAELAADSLLFLRDKKLIDDNIIDIIPYDESKFNNVADKNKISLMPFYTAIRAKFKTEELLPAGDGVYVRKENARRAEYSQLADLFPNEQLSELIGNAHSKWVFASESANTVRDDKKRAYDYVAQLPVETITTEKILKSIKGEYIKKQKISWLHEFYKYLYTRGMGTYKKLWIKMPIFIDTNGDAVAAFDDNEQSILFLPVKDRIGYITINPALLENQDTKKFVEELGIKEPSLGDQIYNKILPLYQKKVVGDTKGHFLLFFQYYKECSQHEADNFIDLLKGYKFILFRTTDGERTYRGKADELYFPEELLKEWFQNKPDTKFVAIDEYLPHLGEKDIPELFKFLSALGVSKSARVRLHPLSEADAYKIKPEHEWPKNDRFFTIAGKWTDSSLDGGDEFFKDITPEKSEILWKVLLDIIAAKKFDSLINGNYTYFYKDAWGIKSVATAFDSYVARKLCEMPWLLDNNDELAPASELTLQTLSPGYDTSSGAARELIRFLGIKDETKPAALTIDQQKKIALVNAIPLEYLKRFVEGFSAGNPESGGIRIGIKTIYDWWANKLPRQRDEVAKKYDASFFPFWYNRNDLKNENEKEKYHKAWLVLFAIAVCQQLGYKKEQHRGFIEFLDENDWLDMMVAEKTPAAWMEIIQLFYEGNCYDQEYNYWFRTLPELYVIRRHLDEYIHLFKNMDKIPESQRYDLQTILMPETNPLLKGSGIHLPALNRTLKLGGSIIIRELLRTGILAPHKNIIEHAFAPHSKTRNIVFGDEQERTSKEIFSGINAQLGKNGFAFDGYYDIPILLYEENNT
jgi:hypothetical protein